MHAVHKFLRWALFIVFLGSTIAGGYAYYLWNHSDEMLKQSLETALRELAPEWKVEMGRTRLDFQGRIRIFDLKVFGADDTQAVLEVPEAIITVDRNQLTEKHPPVQHVQWMRPILRLVRKGDGRWNFSPLLPLPKMSGALAEWHIEQGAVAVRWERLAGEAARDELTLPAATEGLPRTLGAAGSPTDTEWAMQGVNLRLIPSGRRQYSIKCQTHPEFAESARIEGQWNLDVDNWHLQGDVQQIQLEHELGSVLAELSPQFRENWLRLQPGAGPREPALAAELWAAPSTGGVAAGARQPGTLSEVSRQRTATRPQPRGRSELGTSTPRGTSFAGARGVVDLQFRLGQFQKGADCEYRLALRYRQGEIDHPALPFALSDVQAQVVCDNEQLVLEMISARQGETRFGVQGKVIHHGEAHPAELTVVVQDLSLEPQMRSHFPHSLRNACDLLQCTGKVDAKAKVISNGKDHWEYESTVSLKGCSAQPLAFPYLVEQIQGTITQRGDLFDLELKGVASERPVMLTGRLRNPGPEFEGVFDISVTDLPLDSKFRAACPGKLQATLDSLRLQGSADAQLRLVRPAGPRQKFVTLVKAQLHDCSATPQCFPYRITGISGRVEGAGDEWRFDDLKGLHETARIQAKGAFLPDDEGRHWLDLAIQADGARCDNALQAALPEDMQTLWREFNPAGDLQAVGRVLWTPGRPPQIVVDAELTEASMNMKSFPYVMEQVRTRLRLSAGRVEIKSFTARHDETRIKFFGLGQVLPDGEWRVRLEELVVEDLDPDRRFRKTLSPRLRDIFETLDPRGKLTVTGMLEFRGTNQPRDPVTAAWDLQTVCSGTALTAGIDLENLHGKLVIQGTWDGERVVGSGRVDLDSMSFRKYQLTQVQGPVSINGTQLVIGSKEVVNSNSAAEGAQVADTSKRLTARFIDGTLALDGIAVLEGQTSYHVRMALTGGKLERFAQLYLPGRNKLMGAINGWVDLYGKGSNAQRLSGRGQLLIAPAALYELPVIVAIFKVLSFVPPDKTAFKTALTDFEIGGGQFQFRKIDLVGDTIALRGRGFARFDGTINLDFYSTVGKNQVPIPILKELIGEATKGWVGVQVRGTTSNPIATIRAIPQMDDALRNFLGIFEARPLSPPPAAGPAPFTAPNTQRDRPSAKR